MKITPLILALILLASCQNGQQKNHQNHAELSSKIDSLIDLHGLNGVILVSSGLVDIYSKAVGFSDIEAHTKMDVNDQFVIGSISKQITATLILREYEKGKIGLNDSIDQYLPELPQTWATQITIHQLLTHTHGIVDLNAPLAFEPGSQFQYSQLGYELLAQVLEQVTKKTFARLSTELFEEHGLHHTFHPNSQKHQQLVKGYVENEQGTLVFATNSLRNYVPAGSFISNAKDLVRWNKKLYSGQLVGKATLDLMKTKYATRIHPIFETVEYGYGLLFKDGEQSIQIGALGYAPGFVSASYHYPQSNINLAILENTATNLHDFRQTFKVHTELMELIKKQMQLTPQN